jgi:hypothetical protein
MPTLNRFQIENQLSSWIKHTIILKIRNSTESCKSCKNWKDYKNRDYS